MTRLRRALPAELAGVPAGAVLTFAIGAFGFANYWYPLVPLQERAILAALTACALFLVTAPRQAHPFWRYSDPVHAVLALVAFGYIVLEWQQILMRQGAPTPWDMYLGALAIYLIGGRLRPQPRPRPHRRRGVLPAVHVLRP